MNSSGSIFYDNHDPVTAGFLSADPLIQDITSCLSFNSYAYCMNNPLKYSDPSGYIFTNKGDPCNQNDNGWSWWDHIASKWHNRRRWLSDEPGTHGGSAGIFNYTHSTNYNIGGNSTNYFYVEGGVSAHGGGAAMATNTAYVPNAGNINNSPAEQGEYTPILYSNQSEGLRNLINGCFVDNNPNNLWRYERLAFITRAGIVVLPGSGDGWTNDATHCHQTLSAGIAEGVITGNYIFVDGKILTIEGSIHIHPSCDQLVAIGKIKKEYCDELEIGPSWYDSYSLYSYGSYFVYDFNNPYNMYEWIGLQGESDYQSRKLPFNSSFNFRSNLNW